MKIAVSGFINKCFFLQNSCQVVSWLSIPLSLFNWKTPASYETRTLLTLLFGPQKYVLNYPRNFLNQHNLRYRLCTFCKDFTILLDSIITKEHALNLRHLMGSVGKVLFLHHPYTVSAFIWLKWSSSTNFSIKLSLCLEYLLGKESRHTKWPAEQRGISTSCKILLAPNFPAAPP